MDQSRGLTMMPFTTMLTLSALFSLSTAKPYADSIYHKTRMEMPDSPPPPPPTTPPSSYWNFTANGLPVSYRVAIIIDIFVLIVTLTSLCLLGWYMRLQYRKRKLLSLIREREYEVDERGKVDVGDKGRFDFDVDGVRRGIDGGVNGGWEREREGRGGRGKKGHVRWGSRVKGGSVDLDCFSPSIWDWEQGEPSTPSPTKVHGMDWGIVKAGKYEEKRLEIDNEAREKLLEAENYMVGSFETAKSSPMAKEFRGDPMGKGKGARVHDEEEGYRRGAGRRQSLLAAED